MSKIRIFEHISIDGVIAPGAPDDDSEYTHGGWTAPFRSPGGAEAIAEAQGDNFDLLLGRRTYDLWAGYWPTVTSGPFAARLNAATKYVATHRPGTMTWGPVQELGGDIPARIRQLKLTNSPDLIVWGSSSLTTLLLEQGLVDEVVLLVYPILLGRGKPFYSNSAGACRLALASTKTTSSGVLINTYRKAGE